MPRNPFPAYGMPDLNPLGGLGGGGMLFDPMRVGSARRGDLPGYDVEIFFFLLLTNINLCYGNHVGNLGFLLQLVLIQYAHLIQIQ